MEKTLSVRQIFKGRAFAVKVETVLTPDGRKTTREIVEHADGVAVIPVDSSGNIVLVKQFRKPIGVDLLEIPAGGIDPGEDPETALRRELQEEIGYLPGKLQKLGGFYLAPGYSTEYLHLYLASDLSPSRLHAEDTDEIEVVVMPLDRIMDLISSGEMVDGKSIAGLMMYLEYLRTAPASNISTH